MKSPLKIKTFQHYEESSDAPRIPVLCLTPPLTPPPFLTSMHHFSASESILSNLNKSATSGDSRMAFQSPILIQRNTHSYFSRGEFISNKLLLHTSNNTSPSYSELMRFTHSPISEVDETSDHNRACLPPAPVLLRRTPPRVLSIRLMRKHTLVLSSNSSSSASMPVTPKQRGSFVKDPSSPLFKKFKALATIFFVSSTI